MAGAADPGLIRSNRVPRAGVGRRHEIGRSRQDQKQRLNSTRVETTIGQEGAARRLAQRSRRIGFLGAELDLASSAEVLEEAAASLATRRPIQISALNVAKLVALRNDPAFRRQVIDSDLVIADGMGIVLGARLLGHRVPERVTGIDLFQALLALCERRGHRVFLLGATAAVLAAAVAEIRRRHPGLQIAGARHGYFTPAEAPAIVDEINRMRADCLFVAMPSPAKERFLANHGARLAVSLQMGIGGSLDVVAGCKRRAPGWMQAVGLEWLWRTLLEPRRLFWRYFSTNWAYAGLLLRAMLAGDGSAAAGSRAPAQGGPSRSMAAASAWRAGSPATSATCSTPRKIARTCRSTSSSTRGAGRRCRSGRGPCSRPCTSAARSPPAPGWSRAARSTSCTCT